MDEDITIAGAIASGIDPYLEVERNHVSTGFSVDVPAIRAAFAKAGLVVVPVEPTEAMVEAGWNAFGNYSDEQSRPVWKCTVDEQAKQIYRAMLAATKGESHE